MKIFVSFHFNVLFCVINAEESVANPTMQDIAKIINGMFFDFFTILIRNKVQFLVPKRKKN